LRGAAAADSFDETMSAPVAARLLFRSRDPHLGDVPGPLALNAAGGALWAAGGRGATGVLRYVGGEWSRCEDLSALGLRSVLAASKNEAWVAGENGFLAWTDDGGEGFETVETRARGCLYGLARDARGAVWVGGEEGLLLRADDGWSFARVETGLGERVFRVVPGEGGRGWLVAEHTLGLLDLATGRFETALRDGDAVINDLAGAPGGVVLAVGDGGRAWRSAGGAPFEALDVGLAANLERVLFWQNEFWITTGRGTLLHSPDGRGWAEAPVPGLEGLRLTSMLPFQGGLLVSGWQPDASRPAGALAFLGPEANAPLAAAAPTPRPPPLGAPRRPIDAADEGD
jgi:photosystem II stability/assembly factor-like uncharacterized protein